ncbi:low molecular weight protein-tyrosine-phosphatase [Pelagovum sp. HNIBRBA483]|uniref:low molecular weight protein-tyrosine-phosphatase n=1 Tax=Pelagovum sp. HNIBRBA483 TaxID=3233341 RepID=UPI0034A24DA2
MRVLFVCLGNICRSPTAEAVAREVAPNWTIDSAGTSDWHVGEAPYGPMREAARKHGLHMDELRGRQLVKADLGRFDLIIAMDEKNRAAIEALAPGTDRPPIRLLTDFSPDDECEIPDPYYTLDFEGCIVLIKKCIAGLVAAYR